MRIQAVLSHGQRLDATIAYVDQSPLEPEILSHWAKYICVLTAGYLEEATRQFLMDYARRHSSGAITQYAQKTLREVTNLKPGKIDAILQQFSSEWAKRFAELDEETRTAIGTIVANRHIIAHGRDSTITMSQIKKAYAASKRYVVFVESITK